VERWANFARDTIGKQIVRAADSIGANIAEGTGRGTPKDNCRFIQVARGSLYETTHFLRRAYTRGLLMGPHVRRLQPLVAELGPRLNAYLTSVSKRQSRADATPGRTLRITGSLAQATNHQSQTTNRQAAAGGK
jgi:four helix bundle protein